LIATAGLKLHNQHTLAQSGDDATAFQQQ